MIGLGSARTRRTLDDIAELKTPAPRASFVADLESRLTELIQSSASGDVLPEVELAPSGDVSAEATPRIGLMASAFAVMAMLAMLVAGAVDRGARHEVQTASDNASSASAGDERGIDGTGETGAGDRPGVASGAVAVITSGGSDTTKQTPLAGTSDTVGVPDQLTSSGGVTVEQQPATGEVAPGGPATKQEALGLRVWGTAARVYLEWDRATHPEFAAYLVLRANDDAVADYPDPTGRTLMLLRIENREMTSHEDTPKVATTPNYRIVAVDRFGRELARTPAIRPAAPLASSSTGLMRLTPNPS